MTGASGDWLAALACCLEREPVIARVVVATVRGSAPREAGAVMLVGAQRLHGTIGGGQLEWEAVNTARGLFDPETPPARLERVVLGADRGQCCGGVVELWIERHTRADLAWLRDLDKESAVRQVPAVLVNTLRPAGLERRVVSAAGLHPVADPLLALPRLRAAPRLLRGGDGTFTLLERLDDALAPVWLYGAGHVGQALVRTLTDLPLRLTWIDARAEQLPEVAPVGVRILRGCEPVDSVAAAPAGARFLILTHSHPLDYALCRAVLERGDFAWVGLIGSASKSARFRARLARDGVADAAIARLVCPIGIEGIQSKWPAAIAVSVAAQLLRDLAVTEASTGVEECTGDCAHCGSPVRKAAAAC